MKKKLPKLQHFTSIDYYVPDNFVQTEQSKGIPYASLKIKGMDLISDYYEYKYSLPKEIVVSDLDELADIINSQEFKEKVKQKDEVRILFRMSTKKSLVQGAEPEHSTPIVYVKEGGKSGVVFFDSIALSPASLARQISKKISVFTVKDSKDEENHRIHYTMQRDFFSCNSSTKVFFRELAGKENGNYRMPNLLSSLTRNATLIEKNLFEVPLPANLLIAAQDKRFLEIQGLPSDSIVHKRKNLEEETMDKFRARFPESNDFVKPKHQHVSSYIRTKGLKYTNIIEIQFYVNQLKECLGCKFTPELRNQFVLDAKKKLHEQGELNVKNIKNRKGLHTLATNYLTTALQEPRVNKPGLFSLFNFFKPKRENSQLSLALIREHMPIISTKA